MRLRALDPGLDASVVARIDARLAEVAAATGARILLAVESGSRAWGFPSPDSDYDCRFLYVRPLEHYLSLYPPRDVIETPMDGVLDVNGWDLPKALRLLLKGNAVVVEWLTSPIVYDGDAAFRDEMLALAGRIADRAAIARHYLYLGMEQHRRHIDGRAEVSLKKILYALRPAMALRWLRLHPGMAVAPMDFRVLLDEAEVAAELRSEVGGLLAMKAMTRELGAGPVPGGIAAFIADEFDRARGSTARAQTPPPERVAEAEALFHRWAGV